MDGFVLLLLLGLLATASAKGGPPLPVDTLDLSSLKWTLASGNGSIRIPTRLPYQAHLSLIDEGLIDDPNIGLNEGTTRWVGEDQWTWSANLSVSKLSFTQSDDYLLVFEGLDTFCTVMINGQIIGHANNAFRTWIFNATDALASARRKPASIHLVFDSAASTTASLATAPEAQWFPGRDAPDPGNPPMLENYVYPFRNWARKAQSDFGWDWGPAYLQSGPHKPAYLIGLSRAAPSSQSFKVARDELRSQKGAGRSTCKGPERYWVQRTYLDIYKPGQRSNIRPDTTADWIVNVTLPIVTPLAASHFSDATLDVSILNTSVSLPSIPLRSIATPPYSPNGTVSLSTTFTVPRKAVRPWYPSNLGKPHLYTITFALRAAGETVEWTERTGFRTIYVNQEPVDQDSIRRGTSPGTRFQFEINGKPFYAQGSSLIPVDTFHARINMTTMRWLLESAALAHQNVVRIWGGGEYQPDEFYDLCDEIGIIAWSEAIYACGAYPVNDDFRDNAVAELGENVQRINLHPSVGLWATNNEGEGYLGSVNRTRPNGTIYMDQYNWWNNYVLRAAIQQNTRSLSFLPSSTTQGYLSFDDATYVSRYSNATPGEIYGDKELYDYNTSQSFDYTSYPVARFVNEFGFHSMASVYTWDRVLTSPDDYQFNSTVVRAHNKHNPATNLSYPWPADDGQSQMTFGVGLYLPIPNITSDPRHQFAQWAYSTQVFQAMYMASEIGFYRVGSGRSERNMGATYWQLNDIWEGSTWSSIEYTGRWKVFHYAVERVQDHVIIVPQYWPQNQTLDIYVVSDLWDPVSGTARWTWYDFKGKALSRQSITFTTGPISASQLSSQTGLDLFAGPDSDPTDLWVHLEIFAGCGKAHELSKSACRYYNEQFWQPTPLGLSKIRRVKVGVTVVSEHEFEVEATGGVAAWVNVEHPPGVRGYFVDSATGKPSNDFYLRPDEVRTLRFVVYDADCARDLDALDANVWARSVVDSWR